MQHELPELPFALDALEPHISKETLRFHHGKHHATYVKKLNTLIEGTEFETLSLEEIIAKAKGDIFNNAAQVWNHTQYWKSLSPDGGGRPSGRIAELIDNQYGKFDDFRDEFNNTAKQLFGSGWVWLTAARDGGLAIEATQNADTPIRRGATVLLTCDVWEHAYYIDYRNARADYLAAFWQLVNWDYAARQLEFVNAAERRRA